MGRAEILPFIEYLDSKRSVDDRALNRHVISTLRNELETGEGRSPLKILEVGAGIGTMVTRLLDWQVLPSAAYTAVDIDPDLVSEARRRLGRYALDSAMRPGCGLAREILLRSENADLSVQFINADALEYCRREAAHGAFDLLIGHAFLDLLDLPSALPLLLRTLKPSGMFYFTLVFDGVTHFEPPIDVAFDAQIESAYHQTMDERLVGGRPSGDRHSGRHLLGELRKLDADILAVGSSDWVVHPTAGSYPEREAAFLHYILDTIRSALEGRDGLSPARFKRWLQRRHDQVEAGELIYLAHQIDVLGRPHSTY